MNTRLKPLAVLLPFIFATPGQAQSSTELEAIVVTATRTPGAPVNPAADVSVIPQERIELSAGRSIAEVLAQEGGVEITTNGGAGGLSSLYIRGTKPAQNVLLIDGFRLLNPTDNRAPLEALPLSAFGQIEVVRGGAANLYGSGAIGGAVQLLSRSGDGRPPTLSASATVGRYGAYRSEAAYGGLAGSTQFNIAVGVDGERGFSSTNPAVGSSYYESDKDGFNRQSIVANLRHEFSEQHALRLNLLSTEKKADFDTGITSGPRPYIRSQTKLYGATYEFSPSNAWRSEVKLGQTSHNYAYHNAGFAFSPDTSSQQLGWMNYVTLPVGTLTLGIENEQQRIAGEGVSLYSQTKRDVTSLLGQWLGTVGKHRLQLSVRSDKWSDFDTKHTGGLLYAYALTPAWSLTGSLATAFRVPSFDDLYYCDAYGCYNNPNLRPEKSRNIELGARYKQQADEIRLLAFRNRIHDAIELDSSYIPQNIDSEIDGATASWKHTGGDWRWNLSYTYQDARDAETRQRLVRRARNIVAGNLERSIGPWRLGAEVRGQDGRYSTFNTPNSYMGGYALANLYATYAISNAISLQARIDNVTDKQYELVRGYNTLGRTLFLTLSYAPK